jgi:hypothetical protein
MEDRTTMIEQNYRYVLRRVKFIVEETRITIRETSSKKIRSEMEKKTTDNV